MVLLLMRVTFSSLIAFIFFLVRVRVILVRVLSSLSRFLTNKWLRNLFRSLLVRLGFLKSLLLNNFSFSSRLSFMTSVILFDHLRFLLTISYFRVVILIFVFHTTNNFSFSSRLSFMTSVILFDHLRFLLTISYFRVVILIFVFHTTKTDFSLCRVDFFEPYFFFTTHQYIHNVFEVVKILTLLLKVSICQLEVNFCFNILQL